jgi:hypothetical protein
VILDDRYVSPEHLRVSLADDGSLVVEDMRSENGVFEEPHGTRVTRIVLRRGVRLRVGHTVLRFVSADQPVAPTARDPFGGGAGGVGRLLASRRATAGLVLAALSLSICISYFTSYGETSVASRLSAALTLGLGLAAWAGAWALVTRITAHRFAFQQHLGVVAGVLLAAEIVNALLRVTSVVEAGTTAAEGLTIVLVAIALAALLYGHLALASTLYGPRRVAWAVGVAVALVGLGEFADLADRDSFVGSPRFVGSLSPFNGDAQRGVPLEAFINDARELQRAVDALAADDGP